MWDRPVDEEIMKLITLGLGDFDVISQPDQMLKTFALGSCVSAVFIDTTSNVVGMTHIVLPDSSVNRDDKIQVGRFADTAIPAILNLMKAKGSQGRIFVKMVGGASTTTGQDTFQIGKRNILAVKKHLWKYRLGAIAEEVGGTVSRTVSADIRGVVTITTPGLPTRTL